MSSLQFAFAGDSARLRRFPSPCQSALTIPCRKTTSTPPLIEFKGSTLPVVTVSLRSLQLGELGEAANALFGDDPFFDGEAAVLDLSQAGAVSSAKWQFLKELFRTHGLNVMGVRGGSDELRQSARTAGLPTYAAVDRSARALPPC
jgi:septum site-determining protein MinC